MKKLFLSASSAVIFSTLSLNAACALELTDSIELHGYGNAGYLQASDNKYLNADHNGTWDYYSGALLLTATVNDKSKFWAQAFTSSKGPNRTHLDWAFLDYRASSDILVRAGQIKTPIGLYNEVRDTEFVQLSSLKPMIYQEAAEIAGEAFQGASFVIDHNLGDGSLSLDAFAGKTVDYQPPEVNYSGLWGARITYNTPIEGLRFMLSGHRENVEIIDTGEQGTQSTTMVSADYISNKLDLKAEYAEKTTFGIKSTGGYLQAGYHLNEKWTPYIRSDFLVKDLAQSADPSFYQRTQTLGVGYKINKNIGVRIEAHSNQGYALPVATQEIAAGAGVTDWHMLAASMNFIF